MVTHGFRGAGFSQDASCEMAAADAQGYINVIAVSLPQIEEWIALNDTANIKTAVKDWASNRNILATLHGKLINCGKKEIAAQLREAISKGDEVIKKAEEIASPINPIWFWAGGAALLSSIAVYFIKKRRGGFSDCGCE